MKITVQSSKVVTPSCSGGGRPSAEAVPLTVFDKVNYDLYVHGLYFFRPPSPQSSVLEAGLAAALAEYREWAGRLGFDVRGNRAILLNGAGAWSVDATADVPLNSVMPLEPATSETLSLHPSGEDDAADIDGGVLMLVQVTRFTCGSFVVGTAAHHLVADGLALRSFVNAWGQATRGAGIDPVPVHDRVSFFVPRDPPRVEFEHRGAEYKPRAETQAGSSKSRSNVDDKMVMHRVNFSREFVAELKKRASAGAPRPYSTLPCVAAHLWRCVTKARGLDGCTGSELRISVNGRARMHHPRVPEGYTGNVVLWARPTMTAGDLVRRPLGEVVKVVCRAVADMDDAYFRSFVDFASSGVVEEEGLVTTAEVDPLETMLSPNIEVESLLGLPFQEFDFGCGPPFFFMPSYPPVEGIIFIVSSFSGDDGHGSIDAYVPLFSQAMDIFKNCCHSLSTADARL